MNLDPEIRDQAYQFFIEEVPELLEAIETGLLTLHSDSSPAQLHNIMRAAHSIKGGSASVEFDEIKCLAHRLETIIKALYSDQVVLDTALEKKLLQAYDCLRLPLESQISTGSYDKEQALIVAEPIFKEIEDRLGSALLEADSFIPSSSELGIDMVSSIFEIDVQQGLDHLQKVINQPQNHELIGELRAQTEVFSGFSELLDLPGFGRICEVANQAANANPEQIISILKQSLLDFAAAREAVLAGDRSQGGSPSEALLAMAQTMSDSVLKDMDSVPNIANDSISDSSQDEYDLDEIFVEEEKKKASQSKIDSFVTLAECSNVLNMLAQDPENTSADTDNQEADFEALDTFLDDDVDGEVIDTWDTSLILIEEEELDALQATSENESFKSLDAAIQSIEDRYESLPATIKQVPISPGISNPIDNLSTSTSDELPSPTIPRQTPQSKSQNSNTLTTRISLDRLERIDNFAGELTINRNGLSLQNEQFQRTVRRLKQRFTKFRELAKQIQISSDRILVNPDRIHEKTGWMREDELNLATSDNISNPSSLLSSEMQFDSLELDTYSTVNLLLEELLEELLQVDELIEDVNLFTSQSNYKLEKQRQLLSQLRSELMWSRMIPLSGVLNRFPRVLRELSLTHQKKVNLKLIGSEVLVDRVVVEKLYDPLLHLLRNGFDHGIEPPEERLKQGKSSQGTITIRACHKGNSTVIEVQDDGRGLNLEHIGRKAVQAGLLSEEDLKTVRKQQLYNAIFEPGFSTATQVSELSGRGVGLDVVRERIQSFNGKITLTTESGKGTTFILRIPLTLTLAKLIIVRIGPTLIAIPSDGIEEILTPLEDQMKESVGQRFLFWHTQLIPTYKLETLLSYACVITEKSTNDFSIAIANRYRSKKPLLIMQRNHEPLALEVDQIITEQELVIKPFSKSIAPPKYINGCTFLGDGQLIPVVDGVEIVEYSVEVNGPSIQRQTRQERQSNHSLQTFSVSPKILIIDDSAALRRTLALSLQKAGYRVHQAKDGREALDQLQTGQDIQLIVCDIEMPRMNGFEFLSQRRLTSNLANIPTIMLTSRSSQKHKGLALQLGANDYFSKPYIEADFLAAIKTYLKSPSALTTST